MMKCGHPSELAIYSAETGQLLFCDLCDCRSRRNDAEKMEAALTADLAQARQERAAALAKLEQHVPHILAETFNAAIRERDAAREALRRIEGMAERPHCLCGRPTGTATIRRCARAALSAPQGEEPACTCAGRSDILPHDRGCPVRAARLSPEPGRDPVAEALHNHGMGQRSGIEDFRQALKAEIASTGKPLSGVSVDIVASRFLGARPTSPDTTGGTARWCKCGQAKCWITRDLYGCMNCDGGGTAPGGGE